MAETKEQKEARLAKEAADKLAKEKADADALAKAQLKEKADQEAKEAADKLAKEKADAVNTKPPLEVAQDFAKPYIDENGNFVENGKVKYYIVDKSIKQVEKNGKLVNEKTGIECSYYENLTPDEVKSRKAKGQIF